MLPPLGGNSGNQIVMILGVALILGGFATLGHSMLVIGLAVWFAFALLAFIRQF